MGENIVQDQVKKFKKRRDRRLKSMAMPTLFDRPDIVTTSYTAAPTNGAKIRPGQLLTGHVSADGKRIDLAAGNKVVAKIEGDGANALIAALREPNNPGITDMNVDEVSSISGFLKTTIAKPESKND